MARTCMARAAVSLLLFVAAAVPIMAVDYTVGDSAGWTTNFDYTTWASGKTFATGDNLVFNFGSSHTLDVVDSSGYNGCSASNALTTFSTGPVTYNLKTTGTHYFICGVPGHCSNDMKLSVAVSGSSSGSPPSSSAPTTPSGSPPSTTTGSPPPPSSTTTTPSSAAAISLSTALFGAVVAVLAALS
ncbi:hypothetical protein AMTRI_Chr04g183100 [Amborella trichopoda]|uniref:Phytocyanin domain-containing protein n=1 Tax=Amborella trichopoda TaxID=13333 RepID=W1NJE3_AMBTC|nr:blue copper protein [Amborella trichopoda]ERM95344.1 hypothetical protein AMTR_s00008p00175510 [Amborella trichopoda]|eukprot:XP_006827928.1 blue copper protein [Amborella trichopoda]